MSNICIIPSRGGSKGIPRKNMKLFNGKPLLYYSIVAANSSCCFSRIIVSSEDDEIQKYSKSCGVEVRNRPIELARDNIHSVFSVTDIINNCNINDEDSVCMLLPTSPLRTEWDIINAYKTFYMCDSVISVVKCDKTISSFRKIENDLLLPLMETNNFEIQRQNDGTYVVNGSIYISTAKNIKNNISFHKGRIRPYIMSKLNSVDINDCDDWKIAEFLMKERR